MNLVLGRGYYCVSIVCGSWIPENWPFEQVQILDLTTNFTLSNPKSRNQLVWRCLRQILTAFDDLRTRYGRLLSSQSSYFCLLFQSIWCAFAESLGLIGTFSLTRLS